jgi:hypothetical protein
MHVDVIFRMASYCDGACTLSATGWSVVTDIILVNEGMINAASQMMQHIQLTSSRHNAAATLRHPLHADKAITDRCTAVRTMGCAAACASPGL